MTNFVIPLCFPFILQRSFRSFSFHFLHSCIFLVGVIANWFRLLNGLEFLDLGFDICFRLQMNGFVAMRRRSQWDNEIDTVSGFLRILFDLLLFFLILLVQPHVVCWAKGS